MRVGSPLNADMFGRKQQQTLSLAALIRFSVRNLCAYPAEVGPRLTATPDSYGRDASRVSQSVTRSERNRITLQPRPRQQHPGAVNN